MSVRILLVDDHKIMRAGLRALLETQTGFTVVAEAANGREAVALARDKKPDVIVMDVAMADMNGIEATTNIRAGQPDARIIALTMYSDKMYLTEMLRAGTVGYLLKDCAAEELVTAVRAVMAGKGYITADIAPLILEDYSGKPLPSAQHNEAEGRLKPKETELLQLLADGLTVKEIAEKLEVSVKTVERYRAQLMEKLQLFSIAELTKYAIRHGISSLS